MHFRGAFSAFGHIWPRRGFPSLRLLVACCPHPLVPRDSWIARWPRRCRCWKLLTVARWHHQSTTAVHHSTSLSAPCRVVTGVSYVCMSVSHHFWYRTVKLNSGWIGISKWPLVGCELFRGNGHTQIWVRCSCKIRFYSINACMHAYMYNQYWGLACLLLRFAIPSTIRGPTCCVPSVVTSMFQDWVYPVCWPRIQEQNGSWKYPYQRVSLS